MQPILALDLSQKELLAQQRAAPLAARQVDAATQVGRVIECSRNFFTLFYSSPASASLSHVISTEACSSVFLSAALSERRCVCIQATLEQSQTGQQQQQQPQAAADKGAAQVNDIGAAADAAVAMRQKGGQQDAGNASAELEQLRELGIPREVVQAAWAVAQQMAQRQVLAQDHVV